jgi:hypothetical protein
MNLDSNIIQKTIQSLLTDVTPKMLTGPKVLTTIDIPDISEVIELSTSASADEQHEQHEQDDSEENDKEKKPHKKRKSHHAISVLYEKMNAANLEMNTQKNAGCFKYQETVVDVQSQVPRPNSLSNTYLTTEMTEYIKTESKKILTFECTINNRTIRLIFIIFKNNNFERISYYKTYAHRVYMWLSMISKKSTCVEMLTIYVYLTPFKKQLPANKSESIGPVHANTGYTYRCEKENEIVIYREEEWFKVVLHETMHAFGNDFSTDDDSNSSALKQLFSLPPGISIRMSETYSEIWARIMNVVFQTYFKNPPSLESRSALQFKKNVEFYLHLESIFSLYQCIKILDFMGVNYQLLIGDSEHSKKMIHSFYRENTNVFAYYVLTSVLLNNHDTFLSWCVKYNGSGLNMFRVKTTQSAFIELIESCYKKNELLQKIVETEKKVARDYQKAISTHSSRDKELVATLRMTIVGFD